MFKSTMIIIASGQKSPRIGRKHLDCINGHSIEYFMKGKTFSGGLLASFP